jgi:hypothetical protein
MIMISRRAALRLGVAGAAATALPRFAIAQTDNCPAITVAAQKVANSNTLNSLNEQSDVGSPGAAGGAAAVAVAGPGGHRRSLHGALCERDSRRDAGRAAFGARQRNCFEKGAFEGKNLVGLRQKAHRY